MYKKDCRKCLNKLIYTKFSTPYGVYCSKHKRFIEYPIIRANFLCRDYEEGKGGNKND